MPLNGWVGNCRVMSNWYNNDAKIFTCPLECFIKAITIKQSRSSKKWQYSLKQNQAGKINLNKQTLQNLLGQRNVYWTLHTIVSLNNFRRVMIQMPKNHIKVFSATTTCLFLSDSLYHHVTYMFQSESTLYSCRNVKELFAQNMHNIWS